ncbi:hypothetical protein BLA29_007851 [Euroglyphus maynei]|uniref:Uncharacterized protein n=1 Tax=Euroglyphus maynei TaxID=6958 RepID=A0A1Y3BIT9_EURMA|nr:hypothetical protein BLA29_007851 [Euroglyphus maynei]
MPISHDHHHQYKIQNLFKFFVHYMAIIQLLLWPSSLIIFTSAQRILNDYLIVNLIMKSYEYWISLT